MFKNVVAKRDSIFDIDRFIDEIFDRFERFGFDRNFENETQVNIINEKDKSIFEIAVPGFIKDDIKVELKENILTIKGQKKIEDKKKYSQREIIENFAIAYELDEDKFNLDKIETKLKNGILYIEVPKKELPKEEKNIKSIPIKIEEG